VAAGWVAALEEEEVVVGRPPDNRYFTSIRASENGSDRCFRTTLGLTRLLDDENDDSRRTTNTQGLLFVALYR
jgi:hypothetical protein